jgi:tetratricopeptide (TPR) repeat protein
VLDVDGLGLAGSGNGGSGALHLFVERATQVDPDFSLDSQRAGVHRICTMVEGLPLGIELAASWVSVLSCEEIAAEIEQNIDFLATSMRDVPDRHRSLRAAFDYPWRLLSGEQQEVLMRLSVFRGDFDRAAAAAAAGADLRTLSDLVSKSLVRRTDFGRYELHELLRQYCAEKLASQSSDALAAVRERHARHYLGMLNERREALVGRSVVQARDELRRELGNLRVAAEWAVATWPHDEAQGVLASLDEFFFAHSWLDGAETFERLTSVTRDTGRQAGGLGHASPVTLAAVTYRAKAGSMLGYDEELERLALECLPRLRELGMTWELGSCLLALGTNACYGDVYREAADYLEEAVATARRAADRSAEAHSLMWLGFVQLLQGDLGAARTSFEAAHATAERLGNPQVLAYALSKLGILADAEEHYADALHLHMRANELFTSVGDIGGAGYALSRASLSAFGMGDFEEALSLGRAGYEAFSEANHRWGKITALCRIGFAALALSDIDVAQRSFRAALEQAYTSAAISLELLALSGLGAVLHATGEREQAATVLTFTLGHEQLPAAYSFAARPALEVLESELPPEQLAAARLAAAEANLDALIAQAVHAPA